MPEQLRVATVSSDELVDGNSKVGILGNAAADEISTIEVTAATAMERTKHIV
ncbi:hypothetical protein [Marivita geojedonensis]|uniref:hypothetical protein n=1 Tax=Marivita geojedonensis TaxID=1123756 RepID=UPI00130222CD|nr:hypothetical protein [Marivita geojedonensis]